MAVQADIPSILTDDDKALMFPYLDAILNSTILYALLHGMYTGILAVSLWNICEPRASILRHPSRREWHSHQQIWSLLCSAFIENGQSFWTVFSKLVSGNQAAPLEKGILSLMSTILADSYIIWCCCMVLGRYWLIVLLPILCLISATVSKIVEVYYNEPFPMLYISFVLATTLLCTLLMVIRILTVAGVRPRRGTEGRLRVYHRFIDVLVKSSALYSISLILFLAFTIHDPDDLGLYYFGVIADIAKGITPTLLAGRFTTRHRARPDDSWQGSVMALTSNREQEQEHSRIRMSSQEDRPTSLAPDDLEAQCSISVREPSPTPRSVSVVADPANPNIDDAPESETSSLYFGHRLILHDSLPTYEDATHISTILDEAAAPS
ncbi:uncharacterized protein EV420DRAFT_616436 [Desarmillaria tabescens]|uniref:Uncharacterized protein n=1 Tax=Armillaria tabescens TaxID=1929756 RepID=A0AA39N0U1_ARMTA|nr:uncharacterized protein EV420DRAFT_616436 [Desarmillaria tabescens]KAK0454036.1 hypothetical protein EV420DRAFT_616436 [Desarmillaria tabescens]